MCSFLQEIFCLRNYSVYSFLYQFEKVQAAISSTLSILQIKRLPRLHTPSKNSWQENRTFFSSKLLFFFFHEIFVHTTANIWSSPINFSRGLALFTVRKGFPKFIDNAFVCSESATLKVISGNSLSVFSALSSEDERVPRLQEEFRDGTVAGCPILHGCFSTVAINRPNWWDTIFFLINRLGWGSTCLFPSSKRREDNSEVFIFLLRKLDF